MDNLIDILIIVCIILFIMVIALLLWVYAVRTSKLPLPKNKFFKFLLDSLLWPMASIPLLNFRDFLNRLVAALIIFILSFILLFFYYLIGGF